MGAKKRSVDEVIRAVCGNGPLEIEDVAEVQALAQLGARVLEILHSFDLCSRDRDGELPNREKIDGFGFIEHAARALGLLGERAKR